MEEGRLYDKSKIKLIVKDIIVKTSILWGKELIKSYRADISSCSHIIACFVLLYIIIINETLVYNMASLFLPSNNCLKFLTKPELLFCKNVFYWVFNFITGVVTN